MVICGSQRACSTLMLMDAQERLLKLALRTLDGASHMLLVSLELGQLEIDI